MKHAAAEAAARSGRSLDDIILVAVGKYAEVEDIRRLIELGHRDFGENRAAQLCQRAAMLEEWAGRVSMLNRTLHDKISHGGHAALGLPEPHKPIRWHMIGHLQRNKAKKVAEHARLIHSVDSLRLAEELQAIGNRRDEVIEVLVQVNIADEDQKHGCPLPAVIPLCEQIHTMISVRVRGLMCMAPFSENPEDSRSHFGRCRELFEETRTLGISDGKFNLLSMGMSGDYLVGIEEGANVVRVGSAIFGERPVTDTPDEDDADD